MIAELKALIYSASAQGRPLWAAQVRSYCEYTEELVQAWKLAQSLGVEIKGELKHYEWREIINSA